MSKYFSLQEFTFSAWAERNGVDNSVPPALMDTALATLKKMDVIREFMGFPIFISSGYRNLRVNRAAPSGDTSDHLKALAVDCKIKSMSPYIMCKALIPHMERFGIHQIIREFNAPGTLSGWTHLGFNPATKAVNRILTIDSRGTRQGIGEP